MNAKPPSLRKHKTGVYFCRWGGQDHYFTLDYDESYPQYLESLARWGTWRKERNATRFPPLRASKPVLVAELVTRFLDFKELEGGKSRRSYYANHLRRFNNAFGGLLGAEIRASHLQALKSDMLREQFDPRTINHDLSCVKSLFNWSSGMEFSPAVNLRFAKPLPLAPTPDRSIKPDEVDTFLRAVPMKIRAWLAVNYLAMLRPSEVVRVVNQQGVWEEPWLFRFHKSKMETRTQEHRRAVFSDAALAWLKRCERAWTRQDAYWRAVSRALDDDCAARVEHAKPKQRSSVKRLPYSPHVLRHSAATHLAQAGVSRTEIDLLLGHLPPRVSRTYNRIDWKPLRDAAARLSVQSDLERMP